MYEQPVLTVEDPQAFGNLRGAIERAFSPSVVPSFLKSVERAGLRIRHFEPVLDAGLFGGQTRAEYTALGDADRGQIREFYLASLERVAPDLRERFFKLYAYY